MKTVYEGRKIFYICVIQWKLTLQYKLPFLKNKY